MTADTPIDGHFLSVFVPTFKRPALLIETLESLRRQKGCGAFKIVVADNDALAGEGEAAALQWASRTGFSDRLTAIRIKERGLSNCRNGGLMVAFEDRSVTAVAMIDDDSLAGLGWVAAIERGLAKTNAALLGGPTIYSFAVAVPPWISDAEMFGVPFSRFGAVPRLRSSNNCIIGRRLYELFGPELFHPAFGRSGGEDIHLFAKCKKCGVEPIWLPDAVVEEEVPPERCTEEWVLRRHGTSANNTARIDRMINGFAASFFRQTGYAARECASGFHKSLSSDDGRKFVGRLRFAAALGRVQGLVGRKGQHG